MSLRRRSVLKMLPFAAAGLIAGRRLTANRPADIPLEKMDLVERSYKGPTLDGWEMALGDALFTCPEEREPDFGDIETLHTALYSELRANILHRKIMAHNINFYRIRDDLALQVAHICGYKFRLPYVPQQDSDKENGQTIEGGFFIWDGKGSKLDYGMAFQWVINPWYQFGQVNAWLDDTWVPVGQLDPQVEALKWHTVRMIFDYPHRTTALFIDGQLYPSFFATEEKDWDELQTAARLQAEVVSIYPVCKQPTIPSHRAEFRDWYWFWASARTRMPVGLNLLPDPTLTVMPTAKPSCDLANIVAPKGNESVSQPFDVVWVPNGCRMVLQAYQNEEMIYEQIEAISPTSIDGISTGYTQLKLWVPGSSTPSDTIWVNIIPTASPTPTITPATASPTPLSCAAAIITAPVADETVARPFNVCWAPDGCTMVLQVYQNDKLVHENKTATSCTSITAEQISSGRTLLKLWVPGASTPANELWITVV